MNKDRIHNYKNTFVLTALICIFVSFVLIIISFLLGNKKVTSSDGDVSVSESMTCSKDGILYPFFKYDNSKKKSLKIDIILKGDKLYSINLVAGLYYDSVEQIKTSNNENHAALNQSFSDNSMESDSLKANFSSFDDSMQLSLYAEANDLNSTNAKYFLMGPVSKYSKDKITKELNSRGLDCVIKE